MKFQAAEQEHLLRILLVIEREQRLVRDTQSVQQLVVEHEDAHQVEEEVDQASVADLYQRSSLAFHG